MSKRKYSLTEIDRLREAVSRSYLAGRDWDTYKSSERSAEIEDRTRTYMAAGIGAQEIEEKNSMLDDEQHQHRLLNRAVEAVRLAVRLASP